ncbi:hypothetical protein glysoja_006202 [Glycine soja]|nr:hypothetical protein glysoja_006202 [Glycine soja]
MAPPPGPYSGTSTLALVARASAFSFGLVYGTIKLKYLKVLYEARTPDTTRTPDTWTPVVPGVGVSNTQTQQRAGVSVLHRLEALLPGKSQISSKSSGEGSSLKAMRDPRCYYLSIDGVEY